MYSRMNENVTYKHLIISIIGGLFMVFVWSQNAASKFEQVDKNEKDILDINKEIKKTNKTIQDNQIELIKGLARIELLVEKNKTQ